MLLKYDEFEEFSTHSASMLSSLQNKKEFAHKMSIDTIKEFLGSDGYKGYAAKKSAILKYYKWLFDNYQEDTSEIYSDVSLLDASDIPFQEVYFYSLEDMHRGVEYAIEQAYISSEANGENRDFDGYKVFCLLQWHGVTTEEFVSIKLSDVNDRKIFIPLSNRTIIVDERTADIINEYKKKQGVAAFSEKKKDSIISYKQNTLYRTIRGQDITKKSIDNVRNVVASHYKDIRLAKGRILDSGRYFNLINIEAQLGRDIVNSDVDIINQVFRNNTKNVWNIIQDYNQYKENREAWLSMQK